MIFNKKENIKFDKLFATLEHSITENEYIIINGSMHDYGIEQVVMCFLERYKMFVEYYYVDLGIPDGKHYIKLKYKRQNMDNYGYTELKTSYTEDYYMNDCGGHEEFVKSNGRVINQRLQDVFNLINPAPNDKILDIGCGRGELTYAIAKSGANTIGVDYSEAAINIANKTYAGGGMSNLEYIQKDIFQMENLDSFDKIVMADIVEHIEQNVLEKILEKVSHSLDKKGILIIHTSPNKDYYEKTYPEIRKQAASVGHYLPVNPRSYYEQLMHINEQSPESLRTVLEKYFLFSKIWTGTVVDMNLSKTVEESQLDNQIFAYACNDREVMENVTGEIAKSSEAPKYDLCKIQIETDNFVLLDTGENYINISLENIGEELITSSKKYPVYLAYHILSKSGEMLLPEGERTHIPEFIRTGKKKDMRMKIVIPKDLAADVQYIIRLTCVAEGFFWFDMRGENKKDIVVTINNTN